MQSGQECVGQGLLAVEEHLTLVGEVAEERALGEADGLGDLGGRRLFVATGGEQFEGGVLEPLARSRLLPDHGSSVGDDRD